MQLYSCKVKINGDPNLEVFVENVTVPEIMILSKMHGHDAVSSLKKTSNDKRSHQEEYTRLCAKYRVKNIAEVMFGSGFSISGKLPMSLNGETVVESEDSKDKE